MNNMHRLSENHSSIVHLVSDPKEFYNPKNTPFLRRKTNDMVVAAVEMTKDATAPNANPIIDFTTQAFSQELQHASQLLEAGQLEAARFSLSNIGNYCVSCHSRADRGSVNFPLPWATNLSKLSSLQKANFYLANRQYELAHQETEKIIQDSVLMVQDPNGWMLLIQKDLSVILRVQNDLPRAEKLVATALKNRKLLDYMKYDIQAWSETLKAWKLEDIQKAKGSKNITFVTKLITKAKTPKYAVGQAGLILYLRASAILHELMEVSKDKSNYGLVLYYAGISAEALKNIDVWKLGEHYFEVCIESSPYSIVAQNCYQQLENLTLSSYPNMKLIPDLEKRLQKRLAKFRDLSQLQPQIQERINPGQEDNGFRQ
jgi:soluble cytochrome b562